MTQAPLTGVRILDLTNVLAGPFCCHQLVHLGAEVIKVEVPGKGDLARQLGQDEALSAINMGVSFLAPNPGKKSITINLKHVEGKALLKRLVKTAYVKVIRGVAVPLRATGIFGWLERNQNRRGMHWFRSLFAIYDVDQMIALDVPWWTYRAIDQVDAFLKQKPEARVFEYGSGASTIWLAKRAGSVHSVEHDSDWFELMQSRIAPYAGVSLKLVPTDLTRSSDPLFHSMKEGYAGQSFEAYARTISSFEGPFDLIVIDGRARAACLAMAEKHLTPDGMIVFDNTKRNRYDLAIKQSGFDATPLPGRTPSLPYSDKTTLLTKPSESTSNG